MTEKEASLANDCEISKYIISITAPGLATLWGLTLLFCGKPQTWPIEAKIPVIIFSVLGVAAISFSLCVIYSALVDLKNIKKEREREERAKNGTQESYTIPASNNLPLYLAILGTLGFLVFLNLYNCRIIGNY